MYYDFALKLNDKIEASYHRQVINSKLTDLDKAYATINYPRPKPHPDCLNWTFYDALLVAGVDEITAKGWEDLCNEGKYTDIRSEFSNWNQDVQQQRVKDLLAAIDEEFEPVVDLQEQIDTLKVDMKTMEGPAKKVAKAKLEQLQKEKDEKEKQNLSVFTKILSTSRTYANRFAPL